MIRIALKSDVPAILDIYGPYILTSTATFEYDVPSEAEFLQRFETITAQFPWLVWEENGEILGYAYASPPYSRAAYQWCAERSVYLRLDARGKGIGTALYAALEAILKMQGYQILYALITGENDVSLHFHEKCGYKQMVRFPNCGFKFGRWLDLVWMEKHLNSVGIPSDFPISDSAFVESDRISTDILDKMSLS